MHCCFFNAALFCMLSIGGWFPKTLTGILNHNSVLKTYHLKSVDRTKSNPGVNRFKIPGCKPFFMEMLNTFVSQIHIRWPVTVLKTCSLCALVVWLLITDHLNISWRGFFSLSDCTILDKGQLTILIIQNQSVLNYKLNHIVKRSVI